MEKRKYLRFELPGRANLIFNNQAENRVLAHIQDFSRDGISFEAEDYDVPDSGNIQVEITPGWKTAENFLLEGNVVWHSKEGNRSRIGVSIDRMDSSQKSDLLEHGFYFWQTATSLT